nr:hypothetical protein [Tanacetum cinerariifolium]
MVPGLFYLEHEGTGTYQRGRNKGGKAGAVWQKKIRFMGSVSSGILGRFKHKAFRKFKELKQLVENQTGRTVKNLRMNTGLELCNREFKQLCVESGVARHLIVAGTSQQNGLAKHMNRTLMDNVRCLLIKSGFPKIFWAEATWYPEGVEGYKLYRVDDESPKIVTSMNVVFNKSVMYKDTLKDSGAVEEEDNHEPLTYQEAVACEDSSKWKAAIKEKMDSLRKNKT